jgi:hypothetical protein
MVTSRDQNAWSSLNIRIENRSSVRVEQFEYVETILTNSIQEEIEE